MNLKSIISFSLLALSAFAASAAVTLVDGGVYQFVNSERNREGAITATNGNGAVTCAVSDQNDKSQLWVVQQTENGYYLRNLLTGFYLTSSLKPSTQWTCTPYAVPSATVMNFDKMTENPDRYVIYTHGITGTQQYAHCAGANAQGVYALVCWGTGASGSKWAVNKIDSYDAEAVAAERAKWIEPGRVYRISNAQYGNALTYSHSMAVCDALGADDEGGYWLLDEANGGMIMRNYRTGAALMSSLKTSAQWSLAEEAEPDPNKSVMTFEMRSGGWAFQPQQDGWLQYGYAHEAGGKDVVCWTATAQATLWNMTLVADITSADVEAKRATWGYVVKEGVESALGELFANNICTELKPAYAAMSAGQLRLTAAYNALPETLRQMVMKVHSGNWAETDPVNPAVEWDSQHAQKFRVQSYEPYSECDKAAALTCIKAYTNLNNITGITGNAGDYIYVMVEKGAPEGSTLYVAWRTFGDDVNVLNRYADGYELHEGLNIISCAHDDSQLVVYYTVTTNDGRTTLRSLTDFDNIKIHIEGGAVNGFFNAEGDELYTPDTNEDWFYYRDRARHPRFCLISKYCLLYLHFLNVIDANNVDQKGLKNLLTRAEYEAGNFDLLATLKAWDDMFVAEQLVMGLMPDNVIRMEKTAGRDWYDPLEGDDIAPSDYSHYFNNRLMGISTTSGYMSASWYRTNYHVNTLRSIIMDFPTIDLWGPAHEFGHMNQTPMQIIGTIEESNNVFSNIALFYRGDKASRAALPSEQFAGFNKGYNFYEHGTWGTTRMWFQLWLYYHVVGHNKKFYPRLYELLRRNPLTQTDRNHINSKDDLLHFAKMCCIAAGEDLTDFFDAWGFFTPLNGYFLDDYGQYYTYLSQEEIDQWKAEVAQLAAENGWKKNSAIIFIDDRVGSDKPGYSTYDPACNPADAGSMGGLNDFMSGADRVSGTYEFMVCGTTVNVGGTTGGVGFIIYDEDGNLIGFANDSPFNVSPDAARKIADGNAVFSVVESTGNEIEVLDVIRQGDFDSQMNALTATLAKAEELLGRTDFSNKKVGYLKPRLVVTLQQIYESVKAMVDNGEVTAENVVATWAALNNEVLAVDGLELNFDNAIGIRSGGIYTFSWNKLYKSYGIKPSADGQTVAAVPLASINADDPVQQWIFTEISDENGSAPGWCIQNVSNGKYINLASADEKALPLSDTPQKFIAEIHSPGFVSLAADVAGVAHNAIHAAYGRNTIVRWGASADASQWTLELVDGSEDLRSLIEETRILAGEIGTNNEIITPLALDADNVLTAADHILISLPEPTEADETHLILNYRTIDAIDNRAPIEAHIEYSADGENWTLAQELDAVLPTAPSTHFASETFEVPAETSYIRFSVTASLQPMVRTFAQMSANSTFSVDEPGLSTYQVNSVPDVAHYPDSNAADITAALRQSRNAEVVLNAANTYRDHYNQAYDALLPHYQKLLLIKANPGDPTAIGETGAPAGGRLVVYDLQGRRLNSIAAPGIYIVNGKKIYRR